MNSRAVAVGLVAVLLFSAVGGLFVGWAGAVSEASISADDDGSGNTTHHSVSGTVDSANEAGSSLNGFSVDYENESGHSVDLSAVDNESIEAIGIDTNGDGSIDTDVHNDVDGVSRSSAGTNLTIGLGGNNDLNEGDVVIVEYGNVTNPDHEGEYNATVEINPQSSSATEDATLDITDATPPEITNFTLVDDGQDVDLVVESDDELDTLGVDLADDVDGTLDRGNFTESGGDADWRYVANVSDDRDGDVDADLTAAADEAGNAIESTDESDSITVNTNTIIVDDGNVTPDDADAGATVNQTVNVSVSQASVDGDDEEISVAVNDSVVVENATASIIDGSESVESTAVGDQNASVTANVDSGDGGGTAAYTVSYQFNATYTVEGPREETFDAEAIDSDDGDEDDAEVGAVHVNDVTPPEITNLTLINDGQNVDLELNASEELSTATVDLTGDAGGERSLSAADNESNDDGTWTYTFDVSEDTDGEFAADIGAGDAEDLAGNQNEDSDADSLRVNEDEIDVVDATVTNATPLPGETVEQTVTVDVEDVSEDGENDTVRIVMPSDAEDIELDGVGENTTNSSTETTENGELAIETTVNPGDSGGVDDVQVTVDVNATYPESTEGDELPIEAAAFDSDGDSDTEENPTQVAVQNTVPEITNFTLSQSPAGSQDVDLRFNASEELDTAAVGFDDDLADESDLTLGEEIDAVGQNDDGEYVYVADVNEGDDGNFSATLSAADAAGNDAEGDLDADLRMNETDPVVVNATIDPNETRPGETESQTLTASVDGFSRDGSIDEIEIEFAEGVDVSSTDWTDVTGADSGSVTTDGNRTLVVDVNSGDGLGTTNVTAEFDAEIQYRDGLEGETVPLNVTATDSDGAENATTDEANVSVANTNPEISNFTFDDTDAGADLSFDSTEALTGIEVDISGDTDETLGRENFSETENGSGYTYTATNVVTEDGTHNATLGTGDAHDSDQNGNEGTHEVGVVLNENGIDVVDANVTEEPVAPNSTVDQQVTVDVENVSLDGENDTVDTAFVNDAVDVTASNVSSDTGTASLVGGENLSAEIATGSGGGVTDLTLTYNVTAEYPLSTEGDVLDIDATAEDSDGDSDTETNVTSVRVRDTHPQITNFTLSQNPAGSQDVDLRFNASEKLDTATVGFDEDLSVESDLTLEENVSLVEYTDDTYTYGADVSEGEDGNFSATLSATDAADNDAEGDLDANLTVNETGPVVVNATIDPDGVQPNATADQNVTVAVDGFSRDGSTDEIEIEVQEGVDVASTDALDVRGAEGGNVANDDGRTVVIDVNSGDGLGTANVTAEFDAQLGYANDLEGETVPLNVTATDSDGAENATTNETNVSVANTNPEISNFTLNETADGADLGFDSTEALTGINVELSGDLDTNRTLNSGEFTENATDGGYTYTAENVGTEDGTYNATLEAGDARDSDQNGNEDAHEDGVVRNENGIDVVDANVTEEPVAPNSTVDQQVTVDVEDASLDGETDTVAVTIDDAVDVTAANVSSDTGTATLTDAETLAADVETGSGGGVTDLTLTYNVTATYGDDLEGETLAVNASAEDSDGDADTETALTNVSVRDTHPQITNVTLTNESRNVDLSLDSNEELETISVETTGDAATTLSREAFEESGSANDWTYVANVSDGVDGTFNATLDAGAAADDTGNENQDRHATNRTVNTRGVTVTDATAMPETVTPETTVEENLTVSADDFGQDGGTDSLTLSLNDSLAVTEVTAERVTAGDATVTGVERLDPDEDGDDEAVRIDLDTGDEGGTTDVTAAVNATVAYPDSVEGSTLAVDASADDSDGDSDAETNVTSVHVRDTDPVISNLTLDADGQDVDLSVTATEQLSEVGIDLGGNLDGTATEADLDGSQVSGSNWTYTANVSEGVDGHFAATLATAEDEFGNDGADGESDAIRVDTVDPRLTQTRISPDTLLPGEPTEQTITTNVTGLSQDGENDTVRYGFANESAVELENVTAEGANASAVVGENATSVLVNVSTGNETGTANVTLTTGLTATYENATEGQSRNVTTLVNDSGNGSAGPTNTTVSVDDTVPEIRTFDLVADGQNVTLTVESDEPLATLNASLGADLDGTLSRENFSETRGDGSYTYEANVSDGADGEFDAELTEAADSTGNDATAEGADSLVVDAEAITVDDLHVTPDDVAPNATSEVAVDLNVTQVRRDGENDTATLTLANGTDVRSANASADDAAVSTNVSDTNGDGANETITLGLGAADGLGTVTRNVSVTATTRYADALEGTNASLDATVNDSDGSSDTATTNVSVVDTTPTVDEFDVTLNGSTVGLSMRSDEPLETVRVALAGATGGNLTRADFEATHDGDGVSYTTTLAEGQQGQFDAELTEALDNAGNDGAASQNDSVEYRIAVGGGGQQADQSDDESTAVTRIDNSTAGEPLSVAVDRTTAGRVVTVENARPDADVSAHLTATDAEAEAGVRLSDVGITTTANGTATLTVEGTNTSAGASLPDSVDPVGQYDIEGEHVEATTYTVRVDDDRLGERSPDAVRLFDADGTELNATYEGETADRHGYRLDTDSERVAVGLTGANVTVADASLPAANESGIAETVSLDGTTVNVTLRNTGPVAGNETLTVTAANEQIVQRTVSVAANESRTVQLSANLSDLDREGPILIEVDGEDAGQIPPGDERGTIEPDVTGTTADSPFAMATLLVVLVGAGLLARRE